MSVAHFYEIEFTPLYGRNCTDAHVIQIFLSNSPGLQREFEESLYRRKKMMEILYVTPSFQIFEISGHLSVVFVNLGVISGVLLSPLSCSTISGFPGFKLSPLQNRRKISAIECRFSVLFCLSKITANDITFSPNDAGMDIRRS